MSRAKPRWVEPAKIIAQRRADGTYPDGTWIPSGKHLAQELGVSPLAISEAMIELQKAGLVTKASDRLGYFAGQGTPPRERRGHVYPRQPSKRRKYS